MGGRVVSTLTKAISAEPLPIVQPRVPNQDQAYRFRQETVEYLRRLGTVFTGVNIYDTIINELGTNVFLPTATPPAVFVNQIGEQPVWLTVPDTSRAWYLRFNPDSKLVEWAEDCSKPACCCLTATSTYSFSRSVVLSGSPPAGFCTRSSTTNVTGTVQMDSTTNSFHFAGTSGTSVATGTLTCSGGVASWSDVGVTIPPVDTKPCADCALDSTPVTTAVPYDGTNYCTGVIITTVATSAGCGVTVTDTITVRRL